MFWQSPSSSIQEPKYKSLSYDGIEEKSSFITRSYSLSIESFTSIFVLITLLFCWVGFDELFWLFCNIVVVLDWFTCGTKGDCWLFISGIVCKLNLPAIIRENNPANKIVTACLLVTTVLKEYPNTPIVPITYFLKGNPFLWHFSKWNEIKKGWFFSQLFIFFFSSVVPVSQL